MVEAIMRSWAPRIAHLALLAGIFPSLAAHQSPMSGCCRRDEKQWRTGGRRTSQGQDDMTRRQDDGPNRCSRTWLVTWGEVSNRFRGASIFCAGPPCCGDKDKYGRLSSRSFDWTEMSYQPSMSGIFHSCLLFLWFDFQYAISWLDFGIPWAITNELEIIITCIPFSTVTLNDELPWWSGFKFRLVNVLWTWRLKAVSCYFVAYHDWFEET